MTGEGVPPFASLDCSDEPAPAFGLERALEHCYYARDVDGVRRLARQAEANLASLRARIAELTRAGPAERPREAPIRGVASVTGSPP